jgi:hypothetical protein
MPLLSSLFATSADEVSVQVFSGEQGMRIAFNGILRHKNSTYFGMNVKGQLREVLPVYAKQFYRIMVENNISYRGIYTVPYGSIPANASKPKMDLRYISQKYVSPVATMIYADKVLIQVWEPSMIAIEITSKQIADAYRDQFELLWKDASKVPLRT